MHGTCSIMVELREPCMTGTVRQTALSLISMISDVHHFDDHVAWSQEFQGERNAC